MSATPRATLISLAVLALLAVGGCVVWLTSTSSSTDPSEPSETVSAGTPAEPSPSASSPSPTSTTTPTSPETVQPSPTQSTDEGTAGPPKPTVGEVAVLISTSEWDAATGVTVRGYANTVDDEATCTLELTGPGAVESVTTEALPNPTTMSCGELVIGPTEATSGTWTAVLSYSSTTAWGTSPPVVVTVP